MRRLVWLLFPVFSLVGCATQEPARTTAENAGGFTYVPLDPLPVLDMDTCAFDANLSSNARLLHYLPDNTVRMLIQQLDVSGNLTYGASKASAGIGSYKVTVDYIDADTVAIPIWIRETVRRQDKFVEPKTSPYDFLVPFSPYDTKKYVEGSEIYYVYREQPKDADPYDTPEYELPVYVGIGLRATANVTVLSSNTNISGLGVIGAEAESQSLKGSLVVQTLGVNGKSVAAALPISSELNRTTAQNAITAVGTIKALLYVEDTDLSPRVVGFYLPFPANTALVNGIISELSRKPIPWTHHCTTLADASHRK